VTPAADRLPRVCVYGTYDEDRHPRVAVLAEGLAAHGVEVVECNEPWDAPTSDRVAALRSPTVALRLGVRLLRSWWRLWRRARRIGRVDAVLVGYLGVLDVHLARWSFRGVPVVLDHLAPIGGTVQDRGGGSGLRALLAAALDRGAVRRSHLVVVDTEEHLERIGGHPGVVVPVGATAAWFDASAAARERSDGPLHVVFFGLFTPLQGTPVVAEAVAAALDAGGELRVTMIGSGQDEQRCRRILSGYDAIDWRPWVDPAELPRVVAGADVCLGIFGTTPKSLRVVPTKVFQGAAAGCAIVTSGTAPQRRALGDSGVFVQPGHAEALAQVLVRLAADRDQVRRLRTAAHDLAIAEFAAAAVVAPLVRRLVGAPGSPTGDG
jgi:glycosyltransferase involved in cell wall biosynthesis